jgi:hypothetical protein
MPRRTVKDVIAAARHEQFMQNVREADIVGLDSHGE